MEAFARAADEVLEANANLPAPNGLAAEIIKDLERILEQFRLIGEDRGEEEVA